MSHYLEVSFKKNIGNSIKSNENTITKASKLLIEQINIDNLHLVNVGEDVIYLE